MTNRYFSAIAVLFSVAAMACGGSTGSSSSGSSDNSSASSTPTPAASASSSAIVMTATATVKGQQQTILVDSKGMTLYYYTPDKGGKITCTGSCLAAWPPLIAGDPNSLTAGSGVTGKLTVADNPDGKGKQVLYNNWPLYYWIRDKNPGDTTGEGVGGVWFVVPPDLAAG